MTDLVLPVIPLLEAGEPIVPPPGIVYSTGPRSRVGQDGHTYVTKGPDVGVVAAEAVGYCIAQALGIRVPAFVLGLFEGQTWFASRKVVAAMRDVLPWVDECRDEIARIIVLDTWLCNVDRNLGGLLAEPSDESCEIVAIDFEKSQIVREEYPNVSISLIDPAKFWPVGQLGQLMASGTKFPRTFVEQVHSVSDSAIEIIVTRVASVLPEWRWYEGTRHALQTRRAKIREHVKAVWR